MPCVGRIKLPAKGGLVKTRTNPSPVRAHVDQALTSAWPRRYINPGITARAGLGFNIGEIYYVKAPDNSRYLG
jgi:hypothetical protein